MKKLLYLITQSEWGGAQKYVFDLATHLWDRYTVVVACGGWSGELIQKLNSEGIRIIPIKRIIRRIDPIRDLLGFCEILGIIAREKPDIIHSNSTKASILGNIAAFLMRVPRIVFTAHGFVFNEPMSRLTRKWFLFLEWISGMAAHKVIAVSEYDKQSALRYKLYPQDKIVTIHNGIKEDIQKGAATISKLRHEFGIPKDAIIIGTISNLYRTKGIKYFIRAIQKVKEDFPNVYFVIVGDGMLRAEIEQSIEEFQLKNRIIMTGFRHDVLELLVDMDIFVSSSVKEGLPFSLLEAGIFGKPVVATRVGGIPEIIEHGRCGLLVVPANPSALAEAIRIFLYNQDMATMVGEKLREKVLKNFQFSKMLSETVKIYEET